MVRPDENDLHARDIRRAYLLIGRLRGLTADAAAVALNDHAALTGVSLHAAARAVLAEWQPAGEPHRRPPTAQTSVAGDGTGRIVLRWRSRAKAHVSVTGVLNDDLAARLRSVVERALRAGASHLVVDTRRTHGSAAEFEDVITWAGHRLWARRGSLVLREPANESFDPQ